MQVYDITTGSKILTKDLLKHEEKIANPYLPDFIAMARRNLNVMAVTLNETFAVYKIEPTNGKLIHFFTERADFAVKDSCLNCCSFSKDNKILATGGADTKVRLHYLASDYKSVDKEVVEL